MEQERRLEHCLYSGIYGDAMGFLREQQPGHAPGFAPFQFRRDDGLTLNLPPGQWSDTTEIFLMLMKCLIDQQEQARVSVDYKRLREELKLWQYYRHGSGGAFLQKLQGGKGYFQSEAYWKGTGDEALSRILVLFVANKNFEAAKEETFKQILYVNRHPQVILTGLLFLRTLFLLYRDADLPLPELVKELKDSLMGIQGKELEALVNQSLPKGYGIQFEREKIHALMALDRLENRGDEGVEIGGCGELLFAALHQVYQIKNHQRQWSELQGPKELSTLAYALGSLMNLTGELPFEALVNWPFLNTMGSYLIKLRNYQVQRKPYVPTGGAVDLFQLQEGDVIRHPILNATRVEKRRENPQWLLLSLATKGMTYTLYRKKGN